MNVAILGAGAYGLALASILINNKHHVQMWTNSKEEKELLTKTRKSPKLKNYKIPKELIILEDLKQVVKNKDLVIIAVPTFAFETIIIDLKKYILKKQIILITSKGIQQETCLFLSDVLLKHLNNKYAVISGPTFALDIIKQTPIGFSLATKYKAAEEIVVKAFSNKTTKFRRTRDIIGVEICSSVKNVMAIASGILEGMNVTDSTRALFLTESLNDIKELIKALGGNKKTILSFAGFGDILMTCTSHNSRNFTFGYLIGKDINKKEIDSFLKENTVEGMYTLKSIKKLIIKKKINLPIINLIYDIILNNKDKKELLRFLIEK
ncbi:MAG: NAD(P)H-dependent glycerol-3-phosphate dehydrogenase [Bacilli bacterium]